MTETYEVKLPDEVADKLTTLDDSRVNSSFVEALRDVLDLAEDAEAKREELHARRRGNQRSVAELDDDASESDLSPVQKKQRELQKKIRGPR